MKYTLSALLCGALLFASCDEGRIPEKVRDLNEKGRVAKLEANITGLDQWPKGYTVSFAGFTDDGTYAEISKDIKADKDGHVSIELAGIPDDVTKLEVCVINSIRKRVLTFYSITATDTSDTIKVVPSEAIKVVGVFSYLQTNLFDKQCAHCHSGDAWAVSLSLNEGKSYSQLVNVPSVKVEGKNRVTPGNADSSVLYEVLSTDISLDEKWKIDHSKIMVTDAENLKLLKEWINSGAKE